MRALRANEIKIATENPFNPMRFEIKGNHESDNDGKPFVRTIADS